MKKIILLIIVIILIIYASRQYNQNITNQSSPSKLRPVTDTIDVNLYFSDNDNLVKEERTISISPEDNIPEKVVNELIKGPNNPNLYHTIPIGTKLNSVKVENTTALVDFSKEFIDNHSGGSEAEILTIYSVVNTLTDLININKVKFLIDGQTRKTFKHFTLDNIFQNDESIVK